MTKPAQPNVDESLNSSLAACGQKARVRGAPQALGQQLRIPKLRIADTFLRRFLGLMLRGPLAADEGFLIIRCRSVHTAWLRYPIDLAYLNREGTVLRCVPYLKPWRASVGPRGARHVLELPEGGLAHHNLRPGDRIGHPLLSSWSRR